MALEFLEVRQSLPQVSCSDSHNETQYCSASIKKLSEDFAYLTIGDFRLFAVGFFQAEKWFRHMDTRCRSEQQDSLASSVESTSIEVGGNLMPPQAVHQAVAVAPQNVGSIPNSCIS